jgi:asparagine synthase (glutamine-hydrolysing)
MRIAVLNRLDNAEYFAAANVAGLEMRDSTADRRLIEFCLAVPDTQYWREGQSRWLLHRLMGDVLPPEVLQARTRGLQAADWHEAAGLALPRIREELDHLMAHGGVGDYLDLEALKQALVDWPESGWETPEIMHAYRLKLFRGLSVGAFICYINHGNR